MNSTTIWECLRTNMCNLNKNSIASGANWKPYVPATKAYLRPATATNKSFTLSRIMLTSWLFRTMTYRRNLTSSS